MFDPSQASQLGADTVLRTARLQWAAKAHRKKGRGPFSRKSSQIQDVMTSGFDRFPTGNSSKTEAPHTKCTVRAGEILFQPSHWLHEVVGTADEEGKNIAVNLFFSPVFARFKSPTDAIDLERKFQVNPKYWDLYNQEKDAEKDSKSAVPRDLETIELDIGEVRNRLNQALGDIKEAQDRENGALYDLDRLQNELAFNYPHRTEAVDLKEEL